VCAIGDRRALPVDGRTAMRVARPIVSRGQRARADASREESKGFVQDW
jgi:hypothetical protein